MGQNPSRIWLVELSGNYFDLPGAPPYGTAGSARTLRSLGKNRVIGITSCSASKCWEAAFYHGLAKVS
jgi:hypothetical protein